MHPLSLAALSVLELAPDQQIRCAEQAGYQFIGLRLIPATPTEPHFSLISDRARQNKVRDLISSTGIQVLDIEIFRLRPDTNLNDYIPFIALGAELGARNLLVAGNDPDLSRMTHNWLELCEISRSFNITPHMEPMPWTNVKSYVDGVRFVDGASPDLGAVLIDPIHFFRAGGQVDQIQPEHVRRMRYVQFSDASMPTPVSMDEILRQAREDRLPPGVGDFPLAELLARMPSDMPISIEVPLIKEWGCETSEQKAMLLHEFTSKLLKDLRDAKR